LYFLTILLYPPGNRQNPGENFVFFLNVTLAVLLNNWYYYCGRGRWIPLGLPGRPVSDPPNPAFSVKKPVARSENLRVWSGSTVCPGDKKDRVFKHIAAAVVWVTFGMKIKQQPQDFCVEELTSVQPGQDGPYAFYRLEKESLGTPEAIDAICRKWQIARRRIGYGGLKDRHAQTTQYLTILHGPKRGLRQTHLHLHYLGQVAAPYGPKAVVGNRFRIVIRDLSSSEARQALDALDEVQQEGVPNYFDDQRFGSVTPERRFIARYLIAEDYEEALKLALAAPYEHDRSEIKRLKALLRKEWGNWQMLKEQMPRGNVRSVITYLCDHPQDFRGAFACLHRELKTLYLAAYQSYLWNRCLSRWLELHCRPEQLIEVSLRIGPVWFYRGLNEQQREALRTLSIPYLSARLKLAEDHPLKPIITDVLAAEKIVLRQLKLRHFRKPFFSRGERPAIYQPQDLLHRLDDDELNAGRRKLYLEFVLPRGSYATILIKRLTRGSNLDD
jgi:tRNA pseudouridine13 synthase